ncbi:hypothetical protein ACFL6U_08585 [Planctomycetota bacterium]
MSRDQENCQFRNEDAYATCPLLLHAHIVAPILATGTPPHADLFKSDGLHMSSKGYTLWSSIVTPLLKTCYPDDNTSPAKP